MPEPTTTPVALRAQRELTIRTLCDHFAADRLETMEFERRLDVANRATTHAELVALTADLVPQEAAAVPSSTTLAAPEGGPVQWPTLGQRAHQLIVGIMGGATRRGRWAPAQESTAIAFMGGVLLDFRQAQLPPGETVVHAFALMGGVSIVVPPELEVTTNGVGIMGGFDHLGHMPASVVPNGPRLRIDGVAVMGGVDVQVRGADEPTAWDTHAPALAQRQAVQRERHRERHRERRELKRQLHERRRQLKEEARRLKDEWRGR